MRNPNGLGSVYKLPGKRRKPYCPVVTLGYDSYGKQIRKSLGTTKTRKEAMALLVEYSKNPNTFRKDVTFKEIYQKWYEEHSPKVCKEKKQSYRSIYANYLIRFADMSITSMNLMLLQNFFNEISKDKSTGYIKGIKAQLNMIFNYAIKYDLLQKNIIKYISLPRHKKVINRRAFTSEEIEILKENKGNKMIANILILIYTGLRIGEFLNLKISDIDFENKILKVTKSKTSSGIRTVPIHSEIFYLMYERKNQSLFVENTKCKKTHYALFRIAFMNELSKLGITNHTVHDTRHTTASLLSDADVNPVSIKTILGHTNYNLTAKIYTHKSVTELKKAIDSF